MVEEYNQSSFIETDPISIPHRFHKKQDVEIIAFWTAILSWGQRKSIINSGLKLCALMDESPHDFILHHTEKDRVRFESFVYRTFQYTDSLYFLEFFQWYYRNNQSLEDFFIPFVGLEEGIEKALIAFRDTFFSLPFAPERTKKHIASPARKSSCKRLNMFLRWMVRKDDKGVDFGIWNKIPMSALYMPLDVHVEKSARQLGLLSRKQRDWKAVRELTTAVRQLDPDDPIKYDYALFGMGVFGS